MLHATSNFPRCAWNPSGRPGPTYQVLVGVAVPPALIQTQPNLSTSSRSPPSSVATLSLPATTPSKSRVAARKRSLGAQAPSSTGGMGVPPGWPG